MGGETKHEVSFLGGGDAHAILAALTEAKDSSRLPGRDECPGAGETPSGAGLSGKVGLCPCFWWVLQRPAGCQGSAPRSSCAPPLFILA